ncbi:hypothetical protein [Serratia ureilytica]|uniref:hypothetical protein n=1 Tax=Serratia ureilytica TaxID=300181 RepID=UPI0038C8AE2A
MHASIANVMQGCNEFAYTVGRHGLIAGAVMVAQEVQAADKEFAGVYAKLALLSVSDDINASSFRGK